MKYAILCLSLIFMFSCADDNNPTFTNQSIDFTELNETEILAYIEANNLDAQKTDSGLYFVINEQGSGEQPSATSDVTVAYSGFFTNGDVFDQSIDGITFNLQQVIAGCNEGIQIFQECGNGVLIIPSRLAYGNSGIPGIPGGSVIVFDVTLLEVVN